MGDSGVKRLYADTATRYVAALRRDTRLSNKSGSTVSPPRVQASVGRFLISSTNRYNFSSNLRALVTCGAATYHHRSHLEIITGHHTFSPLSPSRPHALPCHYSNHTRLARPPVTLRSLCPPQPNPTVAGLLLNYATVARHVMRKKIISRHFLLIP